MDRVAISPMFRVALATVVAVALVCLTTASVFWSGSFPWQSDRTEIALFCGLLIGASAFASLPFRHLATRVVCTVAFTALLVVLLYLAGLFTSCAFGSCL